MIVHHQYFPYGVDPTVNHWFKSQIQLVYSGKSLIQLIYNGNHWFNWFTMVKQWPIDLNWSPVHRLTIWDQLWYRHTTAALCGQLLLLGARSHHIEGGEGRRWLSDVWDSRAMPNDDLDCILNNPESPVPRHTYYAVDHNGCGPQYNKSVVYYAVATKLGAHDNYVRYQSLQYCNPGQLWQVSHDIAAIDSQIIAGESIWWRPAMVEGFLGEQWYAERRSRWQGWIIIRPYHTVRSIMRSSLPGIVCPYIGTSCVVIIGYQGLM
jgi:hypothetical protein